MSLRGLHNDDCDHDTPTSCARCIQDQRVGDDRKERGVVSLGSAALELLRCSMPMRPSRVCSTCGQTVAGSQRCECQRVKDRQRPTAQARGYDHSWSKLRREYLKRHAQCSAPGCDRPATNVDHKTTVEERPDLRLTWSNLQALCASCHSVKTVRQDGGFGRAPSFGDSSSEKLSRKGAEPPRSAAHTAANKSFGGI